MTVTASHIVPESLNLADDAVSGAAVMVAVAAAAARREHLNGKITTLWWSAGDVIVEMADAGCAVHMANALGLPRRGRFQNTLPRSGNVSGVNIVVTVAAR